MISVTGKSFLHTRAGFTLMEILVVIALIGLVIGVMAVDFGATTEALKEKPLNKQFEEAFFEARLQVQEQKKAGEFRYNEDAKSFTLFASEGGQIYSYTLSNLNGEEPTVAIYPLLSGEEGGGNLDEFSSDPTNVLFIHPSGASTHARLEIGLGDDSWVLTLDPFTGVASYEE